MKTAARDPAPRRASVVLADDTPDIRLLLRLALERTGDFEVVGEAKDGREAVALAGDLQPDAFVLDLAMPKMDGLQALPAIRERAPDTKVLVLSGFQASHMRSEARRKGADAYLEKGTATGEIIATLAELCEIDVGARRPSTPPVPAHEEAIWGLVHELSTPVTAIVGFAEALHHSLEEADPDVRAAIDAIRRNASHLRMLLTSFTDARRIDIAALDLHRQRTDLEALVRDAVFDLRSVTGARPVEIRVGRNRPVDVDPTRVLQAVINLISNAAKFSPPDAPITIDVEVDGVAEIVVTDRGSGIAPADQPRLFAKFLRLQHGGPGSGLGLYISRGLARAHGGDLELVSSGPEGSTFRLWLPVS